MQYSLTRINEQYMISKENKDLTRLLAVEWVGADNVPTSTIWEALVVSAKVEAFLLLKPMKFSDRLLVAETLSKISSMTMMIFSEEASVVSGNRAKR